MPRLSLSVRLSALWIFTVIIAISLAAILYQTYRKGAGSQIKQSQSSLEMACEEIAHKFAWGVAHSSFSRDKEEDFKYALLEIILEHYEGIEGGFWSQGEAFGPYAYPTYDGNGIKRDIPESEKPSLERLASLAGSTQSKQIDLKRGAREGVLSASCPLGSTVRPASAVWTMTRIPLSTNDSYSRLQISLALLLLFVLVSGLCLSIFVSRWLENIRKLEESIRHQSVEDFPPIPTSSEPELNRIVEAINRLSLRFHDSKLETHRLEKKLAHNDRLSLLGKMAAEMAHEIRNPLATIRLKLENALVNPAERMTAAAPVIYEQIERIDRLIGMLLAATKQFEIKEQIVPIEEWVERSFASVQSMVLGKNLNIQFKIDVKEWCFDPFHMARAVENLVHNAIEHSPPKGKIHVHFFKDERNLIIEIEDEGPGLASAVREGLFQPFQTHRKDGIGLGLVLVKDIAVAHGGDVREIGGERGAKFRLEIPWQKS